MQTPFLEIKISEDGSSTLYRPDLDEHYHSIHGAIQESMHIFIDAGLKQCSERQINILEIGFGTGLNTLLTILETENILVNYHSIEKFPVGNETINQINYPEILGNKSKIWFDEIHEVSWNNEHKITPIFNLQKMKNDLIDSVLPDNFYNLVYFDAFAPEKQPELWSIEIFDKIYNSMKDKGILTTYCAKGSVRRAMQACGFKVERIQGPPGKREMIRAVKIVTDTKV